jgi:hypothetical protein
VVVGSAKGLWNAFASVTNLVNTYVNAASNLITGKDAVGYASEAHYSNTTQAVSGTIAPFALEAQGMIGKTGSVTEATTVRRAGTVESEAPTVQGNKAVGDAYRNDVADSLKAEGRGVKKEVTKNTPFGRRRVDIEVSHNGKTVGGVETKTGNSPYTPSQRAKDAYLKQQGYPVNVVRKPKGQ